MQAQASKQLEGHSRRRRKPQLGEPGGLIPLIETRRYYPQAAPGLAWCGSGSGPWRVSDNGLGEVRLVDLGIDFDLINRQRLFVFRARAALINLDGHRQSLD